MLPSNKKNPNHPARGQKGFHETIDRCAGYYLLNLVMGKAALVLRLSQRGHASPSQGIGSFVTCIARMTLDPFPGDIMVLCKGI